MPTASNMAQLEAMLKQQLKKAMQVVSVKAEKDLDEATDYFYNGGQPQKYVRTGKLGSTPRTTALSESGNSVSFEAYLDQSGSYTTGSKPSMGTVLEWANTGSAGIVGSPLFWEYGIDKIEKDFNDTLASFF